jgi:hypothetical protein
MVKTVDPTGSVGQHEIKVFQKLVTGWIPGTREGEIFRDKVIEEINKLISQIPTMDTGYFAITSSETYQINHPKFYGVPHRADFFYSSSGAPKEGDIIYRMYPDWNLSSPNGIRVSHAPNGSYTKVETGTISSGFLRVLLWG